MLEKIDEIFRVIGTSDQKRLKKHFKIYWFNAFQGLKISNRNSDRSPLGNGVNVRRFLRDRLNHMMSLELPRSL